jgi:hypothetical protein
MTHSVRIVWLNSDEENQNEDQDPFGDNYELVKVILQDRDEIVEK